MFLHTEKSLDAAPNVQFTFCPLLFVNPAFVREGPGFTILAINNHPESRGSVSLRSPSPFDKNNSQFEPTFGKRAIRYPEPSGRAKAIAKKFPWRDFQTFIDIGAAQGGLPVQVALEHDHLCGGGFDLPAVGPIFEEYITSLGLGIFHKKLKRVSLRN